MKVPFRRPKSLSDDYTEIVPVVLHALNWFEKYVKKVSYVLVVYPTAVLLQKENIFSALNTISTDKTAIALLQELHIHTQFKELFLKTQMGTLRCLNQISISLDHKIYRKPYMMQASFITKSESVKNGKVLINSNVKIEKLDRSKVIDIDDYEDLNLAELKMRRLKKRAMIIVGVFRE